MPRGEDYHVFKKGAHHEKISAILLGLSIALLGLSGCKSSGESTAYDDVGDMRVFESPHREVARGSSSLWNESVPAPQPMTSHKTQKLDKVSRSFVSIGDNGID